MDTASTLKFVGSAAQLGVIFAAEKAFRRQVGSADVPGHAGEVTTDWLNTVMCRGHTDARVTSHTLGDIDDGSTTRRRIHLAYNDAGVTAGLATTLFTKSAANLRTRLLLRFAAAAESEVGFYQQLSTGLAIETPIAYFAEFEPRSGRYMIAMEDVGETKGATFGNPTSWYVDERAAQSMVDQLAILHGTFWGGRGLERAKWLVTPAQWLARIEQMVGWEAADARGMDKAGDIIPDAFLAHRSGVHQAIKASLELNSQSPRTLLHSDVHLGNWYMTADGGMGLFDWQCVTTGQWASDLAYALMSALTIEDRRNWEQNLLRRYLERLGEQGVDAPGFDAAWLSYRQQTFHGLSFWLVTLGANSAQPDMQPESVSRANIERMTQAIVDLDSFGALTAS